MQNFLILSHKCNPGNKRQPLGSQGIADVENTMTLSQVNDSYLDSNTSFQRWPLPCGYIGIYRYLAVTLAVE